MGLEQLWLHIGWKGSIQPVCHSPLQWAVPALPREDNIVLGIVAFVIESVERPMHFANMLLRYADAKLAKVL